MSVLDAIGNTPMVELMRIHSNPRVQIFVKLEGSNPGGSVKDRAALYMIRAAEEAGQLVPGKTILEPTSGNTGIAIAMIGASKGYPVLLTLPGCVSSERRRVLEAFGAEVIITPPNEGTDGAIRKAYQILEENPDKFYMPNQFANPNNCRAQYETTAPEIYAQTNGRVTAFVAGMGTTGTLMGVSMYLKEKNPDIRIIAVEPTVGHKIQGLKNMNESIVPEILDRSRLDDIITVEDDQAFEITRRLATEEGAFCGISSGAAVVGALRAAERMPSGLIVALLPDRGDRYLSTTLFRSTCANCPP
ncbi:MAG: cysteine synthase family protein [Candidatus Hydrogenedentes bacterium]|nr:cysteine synthase family protein [Candidatus Hydrogenedentota bacterium]